MPRRCLEIYVLASGVFFRERRLERRMPEDQVLPGDFAEAKFRQFCFREIARVLPQDRQRLVTEQRNHRLQNALTVQGQVGMQHDPIHEDDMVDNLIGLQVGPNLALLGKT